MRFLLLCTKAIFTLVVFRKECEILNKLGRFLERKEEDTITPCDKGLLGHALLYYFTTFMMLFKIHKGPMSKCTKLSMKEGFSFSKTACPTSCKIQPTTNTPSRA